MSVSPCLSLSLSQSFVRPSHKTEGYKVMARRRGERASAAIPQRKDEVKIRLQNCSQQKHAGLAVALRAGSFVVP